MFGGATEFGAMEFCAIEFDGNCGTRFLDTGTTSAPVLARFSASACWAEYSCAVLNISGRTICCPPTPEAEGIGRANCCPGAGPGAPG